jgi:peptidoglycan/xylan/chitin deacetylase (PgdA/CDA1 family)
MNPWPIVVPSGVVTAVGAAMWAAASPSSQWFGPTLRYTSSSKTLALTFDDGPNPAVTPRLLDLFDRYSVRATFFFIGRFVRSCPDLVRETAARGHLLANHTETHPQLTFQSRARIREELVRCQEAIATATRGDPPQWMRPPGGRRSPMLHSEIRHAGLQGVVMWSLSSRDWKQQPSSQLINRLSLVARGGRSRGDIVLFHDGKSSTLGGDRLNTVTALEHWLPRWRDAGLEFATIDSLAPAATRSGLRLKRLQ